MIYDVLIIGAGPAGLAAADAATVYDASVALIDDNPLIGGQIWRGGEANSKDPRTLYYARRLAANPKVEMHLQTRVLYPDDTTDNVDSQSYSTLVTESRGAVRRMRYRKLIMATGARELFLPFPGWTLPGVTGAGGLQALSKGGFPVEGKRIVVAGTGPLLLAAAASLVGRGAIVTHVLEQARYGQLLKFSASLLANAPGKLVQAAQLKRQLKNTRYLANSHIVAAHGEQQLQSITAQIRGKQQRLDCDYLACAFGLLPNTELATAFGCELQASTVRVDAWQQTSVDSIYCAGEGTGVGGVDRALIQGAIAGFSAVNAGNKARELFSQRARWEKFAVKLQQHFELRPELRSLSSPDTLVCRCEDVSYAQLQEHQNWRSAKLHTRCGMGACQGRICGAACGHLFGWKKENTDAGRVPIFPASLNSLMSPQETTSE